MEFTNVWGRQVKPALKEAGFKTLSDLYLQLLEEAPDDVYQRTAYELGFDPRKQRENETYEFIHHGPLTGRYQEALRRIREGNQDSA